MSSSKPRFFFSATQSVSDRIGDLFSFTWSSYAGLRELWWQARGFQEQFPDVPIKEIEAKFFSVPAVPGGIDLKKAILQREWAQHEYEFAKSLIFGGCTLYESWAESVCGEVFTATEAAKNAKSLQFPEEPTKRRPNGYKKVMAAANANISTLIKDQIFPTVSSAKTNCWETADEHLIAYRYFKECRNSMIHSSGNVTQNVIDAHRTLMATQGQRPLPFRHKFALPAPILGAPIALDLRDATLFVTVVRRLMHTFDASICVAESSENILFSRVKTVRDSNRKWQNLPADERKYRARIHRLLSASMIPDPQDIDQVSEWLKARRVL